MKARIHNKGLATDEIEIAPKYSKGWERVRIREGRQVAYISLQFRGDLFKDFQAGKSTNQNVLGMLSDTSMDKKNNLESLYKKEIYTPSTTEVDTFMEVYNDEIDFVLNEYMKEFAPDV